MAKRKEYIPTEHRLISEIRFGWLDRIRILFGRTAHICVIGELSRPADYRVVRSFAWVPHVFSFQKTSASLPLDVSLPPSPLASETKGAPK